MEYENELHEYWKHIVENGYVNLPSKDVISYWLSHIELCHSEIERLQKLHEWIPVEDRLPEFGQSVLTWSYKHEIEIGWVNSIGGKKVFVDQTIVYWKPLPQPPEEQ